MKRFAVIVAVILSFLFLGIAFAQDASIPTSVQGINVGSIVDNLKGKAVDAGIFINQKDRNILPIYTYSVINGSSFNKKLSTVNFNLGYASPSIAVASLTVGVTGQQIAKAIKFTTTDTIVNGVIDSASLNVGAVGGLESVGGKNREVWGEQVSLKIVW